MVHYTQMESPSTQASIQVFFFESYLSLFSYLECLHRVSCVVGSVPGWCYWGMVESLVDSHFSLKRTLGPIFFKQLSLPQTCHSVLSQVQNNGANQL